jgi:hypothetical protein
MGVVLAPPVLLLLLLLLLLALSALLPGWGPLAGALWAGAMLRE